MEHNYDGGGSSLHRAALLRRERVLQHRRVARSESRTCQSHSRAERRGSGPFLSLSLKLGFHTSTPLCVHRRDHHHIRGEHR